MACAILRTPFSYMVSNYVKKTNFAALSHHNFNSRIVANKYPSSIF